MAGEIPRHDKTLLKTLDDTSSIEQKLAALRKMNEVLGQRLQKNAASLASLGVKPAPTKSTPVPPPLGGQILLPHPPVSGAPGALVRAPPTFRRDNLASGDPASLTDSRTRDALGPGLPSPRRGNPNGPTAPGTTRPPDGLPPPRRDKPLSAGSLTENTHSRVDLPPSSRQGTPRQPENGRVRESEWERVSASAPETDDLPGLPPPVKRRAVDNRYDEETRYREYEQARYRQVEEPIYRYAARNESSDSVLNLPISPRELIYAQAAQRLAPPCAAPYRVPYHDEHAAPYRLPYHDDHGAHLRDSIPPPTRRPNLEANPEPVRLSTHRDAPPPRLPPPRVPRYDYPDEWRGGSIPGPNGLPKPICSEPNRASRWDPIHPSMRLPSPKPEHKDPKFNPSPGHASPDPAHSLSAKESTPLPAPKPKVTPLLDTFAPLSKVPTTSDVKDGGTSSGKKGPRMTWPNKEKAPITDDLVPYKVFKRCEICNVEYTHPVHAKQHLVGKNHLKKLKVLGLPVPSYCIDMSKPENLLKKAKEEEKKAGKTDEEGENKEGEEEGNDESEEVPWPEWMQAKFQDDFCEVCNVPLSSYLVADAHYYGKKHGKKCTILYNQRERDMKGKQSNPLVRNLTCQICHMNCSSQEMMDLHLQGQKHKQAAYYHRAKTDTPVVSETNARVVEDIEVTSSSWPAE